MKKRRNQIHQIIIAPHGKPQRLPGDTPEDLADVLDATTTYISNKIAEDGMPDRGQGIEFPLGIEMPDRQIYFFILGIHRTDNDPMVSPLPTNDSTN